jgi:hypothetical protein
MAINCVMGLARGIVQLKKVKMNVRSNKDRRREVKNKGGVAYDAD